MTTDSLNYTLGDTCLTESDDGELEDGAQDPKPEDLLKVIEQKFAVFILKLENCFHVPRAAVDDLVNELQYLISSSLVPVSTNILADFFTKHNLQVDQLLIKELGCLFI